MKHIEYITGFLCQCSGNCTALAEVKTPTIPLLCTEGVERILGKIPQGAFKIKISTKLNVRARPIWIGIARNPTVPRSVLVWRWGCEKDCLRARFTRTAERVIEKFKIKKPRQFYVEYIMP